VKSSIAFLGSGGHARSCLDVAEAANLEVVGMIAPTRDGIPPGVTWLGTDSEIVGLAERGVTFLVAVGHVGDPALRIRLWSLVKDYAGTLVSPSVTFSPRAFLGAGTVALHHAHVGPMARIGVNVILNTRSLIEHDAVIGDHCHVSTGAIVNGGCVVGEGAFIGSGAVLREGVRVAAFATIAAGAIVVKDVDEPGVWAGVPARRIR